MDNNYKIAFLITAYNMPMFIEPQVGLIKKYCKDDVYDILVIDNSNMYNSENKIEQSCASLGVKYHKTESKIKDNSGHHANALRFAFAKFKNEYDCIFFLDHDIFPTKPFSIVDLLKLNTENRLIAAGLIAGSGRQFFWAGCYLLNLKDVDINLIGNFTPSGGADTNADSSNLLRFYESNRFCFFNEEYVKNEHLLDIMKIKQDEVRVNGGGELNDPYKEYQLINDGMFMHFRGGGNYVTSNLFGERIGTLFSILQEKTK